MEKQKFGKLRVLGLSKKRLYGHKSWDCICDCGKKVVVTTSHLNSGYVKSCGCLKNQLGKDNSNYKHGMKGMPIYNRWQSMRQRCLNLNHKQYKDYGGRGIKICERWNNFSNFYEDMGVVYKVGLTLERINNDGDYEPQNCKWMPRKYQSRNTRRNVKVFWKGKEYKLFELAEKYNINYHTFYNRIFGYKMPIEYAIRKKKGSRRWQVKP